MGIDISGFQFFIIMIFVIGAPLFGYLMELKFKLNSLNSVDNNETNKRKLIKTNHLNVEEGAFFRKIDWSLLYSGWLKGKALNFEKENIPLVCTIIGIEQKGAWSQPVKMGVNPLINLTKNYLEKFGKAVITVTSVSQEDIARNVGWGLSSYLNVVAGRILIFEINQKSTQKKHSTRIDLGNRLFDDIADPVNSEIKNVDIVKFDLAYTWPEDILTPELIGQFVNHYRTVYNLIFIITPPVIFNGFARKSASCSDCCILIGNAKDDQSSLIDAFQRIKHSVGDINKEQMLVWGVMEKKS